MGEALSRLQAPCQCKATSSANTSLRCFWSLLQWPWRYRVKISVLSGWCRTKRKGESLESSVYRAVVDLVSVFSPLGAPLQKPQASQSQALYYCTYPDSLATSFRIGMPNVLPRAVADSVCVSQSPLTEESSATLSPD